MKKKSQSFKMIYRMHEQEELVRGVQCDESNEGTTYVGNISRSIAYRMNAVKVTSVKMKARVQERTSEEVCK